MRAAKRTVAHASHRGGQPQRRSGRGKWDEGQQAHDPSQHRVLSRRQPHADAGLAAMAAARAPTSFRVPRLALRIFPFLVLDLAILMHET
jgi:hypothetical protein